MIAPPIMARGCDGYVMIFVSQEKGNWTPIAEIHADGTITGDKTTALEALSHPAVHRFSAAERSALWHAIRVEDLWRAIRAEDLRRAVQPVPVTAAAKPSGPHGDQTAADLIRRGASVKIMRTEPSGIGLDFGVVRGVPHVQLLAPSEAEAIQHAEMLARQEPGVAFTVLRQVQSVCLAVYWPDPELTP